MAEIRDVVIEDAKEAGGGPRVGHPNLANETYPGFAVGYPTCSEPTGTNRGCDAWDRCRTKGEGPYNVMFTNPRGRKTATHCRNWMYKLQFKQGLGYKAVADPWMECTENVEADPDDKQAGIRIKRYKMKVEGIRLPEPGAQILDDTEPEDQTDGDRGKKDKETGAKTRVGSTGKRKGRASAKRDAS